MNTKHCAIIGLIILLAILFLYNKQENADFSGTLSNEALQNIASVYNNNNMTVTNLTATDTTKLKNLNVDGQINLGGNINGKKFFYTNDTGSIGTDGNISANAINTNNLSVNGQATISSNGNIGINGNISANSVNANDLKINDKSVKISCDWGGMRRISGVHQNDDLNINCENGRITGFFALPT